MSEESERIELARVQFQVGYIVEELKSVHVSIAAMQKEMEDYRNTANRWRGAFILVVSLGAFIGWLASFGTSIVKIFK